MAYIYAIDRQVTDDVAVRQNITNDTSWVRVRVKAFALKCELGFRHEFGPRSGIAIRFDLRGNRGSFFAVFFGANSSNPVKSTTYVESIVSIVFETKKPFSRTYLRQKKVLLQFPVVGSVTVLGQAYQNCLILI